MVIWFALFLAVLAISFILAYKSMVDFKLVPDNSKANYSLFLINKPQALNPQLINELHRTTLPNKLILSFEKLFKGPKQALVVFGPVGVLKPHTDALQLVELEDYSKKIGDESLAWEMVIKSTGETSGNNILANVSQLREDEQLWWQLILRPVGGKALFEASIRAVLQSPNRQKALSLQNQILERGQSKGFVLLPQAYSSAQLVNFYQDRAQISQELKKSYKMDFNFEQVISILG